MGLAAALPKYCVLIEKFDLWIRLQLLHDVHVYMHIKSLVIKSIAEEHLVDSHLML